MKRYKGPKSRINRRFRKPIMGSTKASEKRNFLPGMHGARLRRNEKTPFAVGLVRKQELRYMYGLGEGQFRRLFEEAKRTEGVTSDKFMTLLETRLDSIVYNMGFAKSRRAARQFIVHGHIKVNSIKVDIPSYQCKPGDTIEIKEGTSSRQLATRALEDTQARAVPAWMTVVKDVLRGTINRLPSPEELVNPLVDPQVIVEFYSR